MSPEPSKHPGDQPPAHARTGDRRMRPPQQPGCLVLSREAVRRVDRLAVDRFGIPSIVLMENAAVGVCDHARSMLLDLGTDRVVILVGPGNNGGDGLALARHLENAGAEPLVLLTDNPDRLANRSGDAATNLAIVQKMGLPIDRLNGASGAERLERAAERPVLVVDALLGTGLCDPVRGVIRDAILQVNRLRAPDVGVLAVDVPSGLDCDTGAPAGNGAAVEADRTVTFVARKPGMLRLESVRWTGEVSVAGIGVPRSLVEALGRRVPDTRPGPEPEPPADGRGSNPPTNHGRAADRAE